MRARLSSMTAGLAVGITAAVAAACAVGTFFYSRHHFASLLETERSTALAQAEVMRAALEHQMIEDDRSLIARMVKTFGQEARVTNVVLLDRKGEARYSSAPVAPADLNPASPTCQACHQLPPDQRGSSRVIETRDGTVLRTVIPFQNREACFECHDSKHRINGVLIFDRDVGAVRAALNGELRWMVAGTATVAFVLILLIAAVVRLVVLRRLQRFETTARLIAAGDLERRVPADDGSDTVSWLAREFNTMADSMAGLLGEVRTQRERLERVLNSIDDGIVVLDTKRRVVAANDAFLERTARSRPQVLGCACLEVAPGLCTAGECPTLACLRAGERQVRICERRHEGKSAWEEVHASPIFGPDGKLTQVVEVWRDISDRRAAEARLSESHRLGSLGLLASGFSHEMNTPLATVLACVEAILRESAEADDGRDWDSVSEHAGIAREQVLRCRGITQHFLRLSRGQASTSDIVDVPRTVTAVARLIAPTARAQGVKITVGPAGPIHVKADEAELQHALINIVLNAVQACHAGGEVAIAITASEDVRIRVTDTGCGIAAADRSRIFEPFFSLRPGGTGLGLFLALNFVRRWGGDIVVTSADAGGSAFDLVFPPAAGAAALRSAS